MAITTPNLKSTAMALTSHNQLKEKAFMEFFSVHIDVDEGS
mgnify:CR=1 FL=1